MSSFGPQNTVPGVRDLSLGEVRKPLIDAVTI